MMIGLPMGFTTVQAFTAGPRSEGVVVGRKELFPGTPHSREEWVCWCTHIGSSGERDFYWGCFGSKEDALKSFDKRLPRYKEDA